MIRSGPHLVAVHSRPRSTVLRDTARDARRVVRHDEVELAELDVVARGLYSRDRVVRRRSARGDRAAFHGEVRGSE